MTRLAEALDALLLLQPPLPGAWDSRQSLHRLYRAARRVVGGPLAMAAATALRAHIRPGSRVLLTTGLVTARVPQGETDGPPGTLALARALALGLRADVVILTESSVVPILETGAEALAASEGDGARWRDRCRVQAFPCDPDRAARAAGRFFASRRPAAVVSIEKLGPNERGIAHTMRGEDVTASQARTDLLFPLAHRSGVLTVGVGDRGNEIGMGGLLARSRRCACPCGGGIACVVRARVPVAAFTSNWGAHAMTAALAVLGGAPGLLHRPRSETRMLREMVRAGAVDGATRERAPTVDGSTLALQSAVLGLYQALLRSASRP